MTTPYTTFAQLFSSYHDQYAAEPEAGPSTGGHGLLKQQIDAQMQYDAVLDEEQGLLRKLNEALEDDLKARPASSREMGEEDQMTAEEYRALTAEHRTWQLIRSVYENRLGREDPSFIKPSASSALAHDPYMTPEDLTQLIVLEDDNLSLYAVLVEHLQSRPLLNTAPPIEARHGYLPSTARKAKQAKRDGRPANDSYDPDFTLREGRVEALAGEDETYQKPLLKTLWDLVRHGELDQAIKVAEEGGEPWRGASLMGGRRWTMGGLTKDNLGLTALEGNRKRALWKKACRAIAKNASISPDERALYAALTCDLPTLLPTCSTWEDHLWARVLSRIESRLESRWRDLGGFWEEEARNSGATGQGETDESLAPGGAPGMDGLIDQMGQVQDPRVQIAMRDPYHIAQMRILQGRQEELIADFADRLHELPEVYPTESLAALVRFYVHLILTLRSLGQAVPDTDANIIIQAYLDILKETGNQNLVAMYAACLREGSGEVSYARFLRGMDPATTKEGRQEALNMAKTHNLDVAYIAAEVVRATMAEAFANVPALSKADPDPTQSSTYLSARDTSLIRSIEWLTMVPTPECLDLALVKANDITRYFLALGHVAAARIMLEALPDKVTQEYTRRPDDEVEDEDYVLDEHDAQARLFEVLGAFDRVDEVAGVQLKETATRMERGNHNKRLRNAIDTVHSLTIDLLQSHWLRFPLSMNTSYSNSRHLELLRIRQTFIPTLVFRLHALLISYAQPDPSGTRSHEPFPDLVNVALNVSAVVADEEHGVYREFLSTAQTTGPAAAGKLPRYLEHVRMAYLLGMHLGVVQVPSTGHGIERGMIRGMECFAGHGQGNGEMRARRAAA